MIGGSGSGSTRIGAGAGGKELVGGGAAGGNAEEARDRPTWDTTRACGRVDVLARPYTTPFEYGFAECADSKVRLVGDMDA